MTQKVPSSMTVEGLTAAGVTAEIAAAITAFKTSSMSAFRAAPNAVTSITSAINKVSLNSELFDTGAGFDTTTSQFKPTKGGYYQISAGVRFATSGSACYVALNKNGVLYSVGNFGVQDLGTISDIIYLNGSTDYVELYAQSTTTQNTVSSQTFMAGCLVRPD